MTINHFNYAHVDIFRTQQGSMALNRDNSGIPIPPNLRSTLLFLLHTVDCSTFPLKHRYTLNMPRLREEVEPPQTLNLITPLSLTEPTIDAHHTTNQYADITRLRVYVTAHIYHSCWPVLYELSEEGLITPFSGWINHDDRFIRRRRYGCEKS